jgi:hypothetical protein
MSPTRLSSLIFGFIQRLSHNTGEYSHLELVEASADWLTLLTRLSVRTHHVASLNSTVFSMSRTAFVGLIVW